MAYYDVNPMKDSGDYIDLNQYFELLKSTDNDMEKMLIMLLWKTGRRVSEIVGNRNCPGLMPKDIDFENEKIHFTILKKKLLRKEPKDVDMELLTALRDYIQKYHIGEEQRIIPRTRRWCNYVLRRLSELTGVKTFSGRPMHAHAFRHSWNITASRAGEHPEDIVLQKEIMSHSNINITMSYLKFAQGRQKELINRMGKAYKNEEDKINGSDI